MATKQRAQPQEEDGRVYIVVYNDGTNTKEFLQYLSNHGKRIEVAAPTAEGVHYVLDDIPQLDHEGRPINKDAQL